MSTPIYKDKTATLEAACAKVTGRWLARFLAEDRTLISSGKSHGVRHVTPHGKRPKKQARAKKTLVPKRKKR